MNIPARFTITTAKQSQHIDAETINNFEIDGFTLMEIAGSTAAKKMREILPPDSRGLFFCGKGNNGGDALVCARYLAQHGFPITIVFVSGTGDLSEAAQKNYNLLQSVRAQNEHTNIRFITDWAGFEASLPADFIVDGMLGTGLDSDLRGNYVEAVAWANDQEAPVVAMDIPTGLHADSGAVMGKVLQADHTFAFGTLKQGFYVGDGPDQSGEIHFCELPFPHHIIQSNDTYLIDEAWLPMQDHRMARHKYEAGVLHVIAGSDGLTGAGYMAAQSAWAEGVGAVVLICPRGLAPIYETNLPHIIKKPIGGRNDFYFKPEHMQAAGQAATEKEGPVLIGSGMGRQEETVAFEHQFLSNFEGSCIIDADALWGLAQRSDWKKPTGAEWILTPHPGELARLLDSSFENDVQRLQEATDFAAERDVTMLSKGFPGIVATPAGKCYITAYDTRNFSRAGFGDVLAGKVGAYQAMQGRAAESCIRGLVHGSQRMKKYKRNNPGQAPGPRDLI